VSYDTDAVADGVQPLLMALNCDEGSEQRTIRSATTGHRGSRRKAKRTWVLATLALLTAVAGALIQSRSEVSATSPIRLVKTTGAAAQTNPSGSAATPESPAPTHKTVDLFGDSLGYQAEPYLDMFFAEMGNYTVSNNTFGGTATCDWLSRMATAAAEHPQAAVLVFSGNAFTPCMDGVALRSAQYYDLYTTDTEQAIGIFSAVGAHVFLVGTPIAQSSVAGWDRLDDIYRQLAQANHLAVTYVDAAAAVESASGGFTWQLPCMSIEPSCGANGTNVVRSPDGVHFCPDGTPSTRGVTGPCDEYSPGAFRFALAMVSAVTQYPHRAPASLVLTAR
jgi:hypothetical protein